MTICNASTALRTSHALLLASCLALGLAACGSPSEPLGESEQPIASSDGDGAAENGAAPETGASAPDANGGGSDACAGGRAPESAAADECQIVARGLCFSTSEAACACAGCGRDECAIGESFPAQAFCPSSGGTDPDGSTSDDPNTPVSHYPQGGGSNGDPGTGAPPFPGGGSSGSPGCADPGHGPTDPTPPVACSGAVPLDPTGAERCDFIIDDSCFDSAASACACAGCALDRCLILESYPARVLCE